MWAGNFAGKVSQVVRDDRTGAAGDDSRQHMLIIGIRKTKLPSNE